MSDQNTGKPKPATYPPELREPTDVVYLDYLYDKIARGDGRLFEELMQSGAPAQGEAPGSTGAQPGAEDDVKS